MLYVIFLLTDVSLVVVLYFLVLILNTLKPKPKGQPATNISCCFVSNFVIFLVLILNTLQQKAKGQPIANNLETLATLGTQDTRRSQRKTK